MRISDWSSDVCSSDLYVAYWTMVPDGKGGVKKLADLYGRDAPVVASFAKPGRPTATIIAPEPPPVVPTIPKIGRASCRERVCKDVEISVVAGSYKKKDTTSHKHEEVRSRIIEVSAYD